MFSIAAVPAGGGGAAAAQPGGVQLLVPLLPVLRARGPGQEGQQRHQVRYQHLDISISTYLHYLRVQRVAGVRGAAVPGV